METDTSAATPARTSKTYFSKWRSHQLYISGGQEQSDGNGNWHRIPMKLIEFTDSRYETKDAEEQAFLEASPDFHNGDIICLTDLENAERREAAASGAPVYKLPERLLLKMNKEDLVDYAHAQNVDLGATDEDILGPKSTFTKEALIALLR